jgi:hypothetical protein
MALSAALLTPLDVPQYIFALRFTLFIADPGLPLKPV